VTDKPFRKAANLYRFDTKIKFSDRTKTLKAWAEETGINPRTLLGRLNRGWPVARALLAPPHPGSGRISFPTVAEVQRSAEAEVAQRSAAAGAPRLMSEWAPYFQSMGGATRLTAELADMIFKRRSPSVPLLEGLHVPDGWAGLEPLARALAAVINRERHLAGQTGAVTFTSLYQTYGGGFDPRNKVNELRRRIGLLLGAQPIVGSR
jgi:hypothetical protein